MRAERGPETGVVGAGGKVASARVCDNERGRRDVI